MADIACIGSRDISYAHEKICEKIGAWIVGNGGYLHTGNACGADQAFARGANKVSPDRVNLYLPWASYEQQAIHQENTVLVFDKLSGGSRAYYEGNAEKYHPAWSKCSSAAKKFHARNGMIILHVGVDLVIAWPGYDKVGGTGQGMRVAKGGGIPIINLSKFIPRYVED